MNETNGNERREVLKLETNVPVVASLKYEEPLGPYPGRYGDQFMYTITTEAGEKVIYLDPPVSDSIQQLGLRPGEPFKLGKFTRKDGNRRGVEWKVRRLEPEEFAPPLPSARAAPRETPPPEPFDDPPPTPPWSFDDPPPVESGGAAPPQPVSKSGTALSGAPERQPNVPQPTTPAPQPAQPTARPQTPMPFAGSSVPQQMLSALMNAMDILMALEQHAKTKGKELHFTEGHIHAVAATCFIEQCKRGWR